VTERPAKILVVGDVPENVRLLEAVLVPRGYVVVTASDGLEALELAAAEEPDLILLGVMMPGLDGYGVCTQLRANEDTGQAAVPSVDAHPPLHRRATVRPRRAASGLTGEPNSSCREPKIRSRSACVASFSEMTASSEE